MEVSEQLPIMAEGIREQPRIPEHWEPASEAALRFVTRLRESVQPLLICDYDGTLAPFRINKMEAAPLPGIVDHLLRIAAGPTKLAFVTGRPVAELLALLPLAADAEIWGMHGREHRTPEGRHRVLQPSDAQRAALDAAEAHLHEGGLGDGEIERKAASVAVHWRAASAGTSRRSVLERMAQEAFAPHAGRHALALLPFDGGSELRAEDRNKGHAAQDLLTSVGEPRAAAFLGDDTTDEDAFRVLDAAGGLALLVRDPPRPSLAHFSLLPPEALLRFLAAWPS